MSVLGFIFGRRLASDEQTQQKIGVLAGLPALGLDGLSSSAYGPEAALTILIPMGAAGLNCIEPITLAILALLTMLYFSYRQTIQAYPLNGGSYTVASQNLGTWPSLLAASALMIDYVLTVAVGISAGIAALVSAAPQLHHYTLPLCLTVLVIITLLNLRGTGEAGVTFAIPTYTFIACMGIVLIIGLFRLICSGGHPLPVVAPPQVPGAVKGVSVWLLLRAFASGCAAMTGVEAVSNGVSAFKDPTVKNAQITLTLIVGILLLLLGSIAFLSHGYHIGAMDQEKSGYQSVLSQLTAAIVGRGWIYKLTIASILAVLCLSANTSFVDFPRLCHLIAKDDFLPRWFAAIGRRLVYSVGVLVLAALAALLLVMFRGITDKLIPLYAVGAFLAFTLSQSGMVVHWWKQRDSQNSDQNGKDLAAGTKDKSAAPGGAKRYRLKLMVNGLGAIATACALLIILTAKFIEGAWITVLAIPTMIALFYWVHRHYLWVDRETACDAPLRVKQGQPPVVLIPMDRWSRPVAKSIQFGMHLSKDVIAMHLSKLQGDETDDETAKIRQNWAEKVEAPAGAAGVPIPRLEFAKTPYREFITPLLEQVDRIKAEWPDRTVAVIIPELVVNHWWQVMLHSRHAYRLRSALRKRQDYRVVVINVPWFVPTNPLPAV